MSRMARVRWTIRGGRVLGPAPFFVMGIVNVTPDSFFDGGRHYGGEPGDGAAVEHARLLASQGAHILDVGGESTRPGAGEVDAGMEMARVLPVVRALAAGRGGGPDNDGPASDGPDSDGPAISPAISVDTYKASTARAALEAGADIVNDISGCLFEPELLDVVAEHRPGYVLMHSQGRPGTMQDEPRYADVVDEVRAFFEAAPGRP